MNYKSLSGLSSGRLFFYVWTMYGVEKFHWNFEQKGKKATAVRAGGLKIKFLSFFLFTKSKQSNEYILFFTISTLELTTDHVSVVIKMDF